MLRSAAATRTEKAEGGDHERIESDASLWLREESEEPLRLQPWLKNNRDLRLFKA